MLLHLKMMKYRWKMFSRHSKNTVAHRRTLCLNGFGSGPMQCHRELQWTDLSQNGVSEATEFCQSEDDMLKDKLVFSINDPRLKKKTTP